jgi:transmembrane sensor
LSGGETPQDEEEQRRETAAHHFARQLDDRSDVLRAEREAWLAADPRNAIAYARVMAAWEAAEGLKRVSPAPDHDQAAPLARPLSRDGQDQQ